MQWRYLGSRTTLSLVNHDSSFSSSVPRLLRLTSMAICTIHLEAASYSSSTKEPDHIYIYNLGGYYLKEEKRWYSDFKKQKKTNIIITETLKPFDSNQDSTLHDNLLISKSKKTIEVLSFVRNVLASLNK